jgi:hypothetical protein
VCDDALVLFRLAFGFALAAWRIWRRMPPKQRQQVIGVVRQHGPRVATSVLRRGRPRS